MDTGPPSACFHAQPELRASRPGHEAVRNRSGHPAPAPFWTVPHDPSTDRLSEMERFGFRPVISAVESSGVRPFLPSMYARPSPSYTGGGSRIQQHRHDVGSGVASPSSVLQPQPLQHTEVRSASVHLHATAGSAASFPGPAGHAPQARHFPDTAGRQSRSVSNPFHVSSDTRGNPQGLGNVDAPSHDNSEISALRFAPANQTWDGVVGTAYAPRAPPLLPPQVRSWEPSGPTGVQLPCFTTDNDTSSVEPAAPRNADGDDAVYTFCCEWTDQHGTCNMDVLGDRVWMSHHLSRHHNVVGHEKAPRACLWRGCTDTMNKGSLARHVVSRHLRAGASCGFCSKVYSRADVARRHTKKCKVANGERGQQDQVKG